MYRALTVPVSDSPVIILNPDICTGTVSTIHAANNNSTSMSAPPSEIHKEQEQATSSMEPTKTYDVLNRQPPSIGRATVGSQSSDSNIPIQAFMVATSAQVSDVFLPETKSTCTEALPDVKTVVTGKIFHHSIE